MNSVLNIIIVGAYREALYPFIILQKYFKDKANAGYTDKRLDHPTSGGSL